MVHVRQLTHRQHQLADGRRVTRLRSVPVHTNIRQNRPLFVFGHVALCDRQRLLKSKFPSTKV